MTPIAVVKYSEFYGVSIPKDPFFLLRNYPTDIVVLRLTKINAFIYNEPRDLPKLHRGVFQTCFPTLGSDRRQRAISLIRDSKEGQLSFFTPQAVLKLINMAFGNFVPVPAEDAQMNAAKFENDLFDSLLIQNDLYFSTLSSDSDLNSLESIWQLQLMQQDYVRSHDDFLNIAPIKHFLFYKYLTTRFHDGQQYINEFVTSLGIPAFFNYYFLFRQIVQNVFESYANTGDAKHVLTLDPSQQKIIDAFSIRPDDLLAGTYRGIAHYDLIPRPIYYVSGEHPVILDFHFVTHIVDLALVFNFHKHTSLQNTLEFSQFKSTIGKSYYEEFVVQQVFQSIYKAGNFSVIPGTDNSGYPDLTMVKNQKEMVMIEVKSAELHYEVMETSNSAEFKTFLEEKFCTKKQGKGTANRGVFQLAKIEMLATTTKLDGLFKEATRKNKAVIYPVLLYTDNSLNMAGVNSYLDTEFQKAVKPFSSAFKKIYPVVAINLSFFLGYFLHLSERPVLLIELIRSYCRRKAAKEKKFIQSGHPMDFFEMNRSFDQYIGLRIKDRDLAKNFDRIVTALEMVER